MIGLYPYLSYFIQGDRGREDKMHGEGRKDVWRGRKDVVEIAITSFLLSQRLSPNSSYKQYLLVPKSREERKAYEGFNRVTSKQLGP